jgi:hypothetical protein
MPLPAQWHHYGRTCVCALAFYYGGNKKATSAISHAGGFNNAEGVTSQQNPSSQLCCGM